MKDLNKNHVVCPQARKVGNRRSEQAKWRTHKPWKNLVEEHAHVPEAVCNHCGKHHKELRKSGKPVYLTINHLSRSLYASEVLYTTWNPILMEIACTMCNWMYESGKKPCPVCHDQYIHYLEPDQMCQSCWDKAHPVEAAQRKHDNYVRARDRKALKKRLEKESREKWIADHPLAGKPTHV
jgi:hypothetical protein